MIVDVQVLDDRLTGLSYATAATAGAAEKKSKK